ncbi:MAG: type II secretion system F family protein, partial [Candidatus Omnitrophota bacterium]
KDMPKYLYRAKRGPQQIEEGIIEATAQSAALQKLTQMGYFPISVTLEDEKNKEQLKGARFFRRISRRDLTTWTRQLANLLDSGLTLYKALIVLTQQTENRDFQTVIRQVADMVKEGHSLSESLAVYPRLFNNIYISMIKTGEVSGSLGNVLRRLSDFGEKQEDLWAKVQQALAYPILMATVGLAAVIVLFTFIIPKLVTLFEEMGQILPLPTRILIAVNRAFLDYWWLISAGLFFAFFTIKRTLSTVKGRMAFDHFKLGLPVLGRFFKNVQITDFSRTLGTMLSNGVPILQAMNSVFQTCTDGVLREEIKQISQEIREGSTLARGVAKRKYFPILFVNMTALGEEAGTLEQALLKVAENYEKETDQTIRLWTTLIEPLMILLVGSVIAFMIFSMLLPIFQISITAG